MGKRFLVFIVVMVSMLLMGAVSTYAAGADAYYGDWAVIRTVGSASADAKVWIGRGIQLSGGQVACAKERLQNPNYQITTLASGDFDALWGVSSSKLQLPSNIKMIEVYDGSKLWSGVGTFFVRSKSTLLMNVNGTFFELKKL